jgi:hypothetical protein
MTFQLWVRGRTFTRVEYNVKGIDVGADATSTRTPQPTGLRGKKREKLDKIWGYFEANRDRMRYDQYLAEGYPITTGVMKARVGISLRIAWKARACVGASTAHRPCSTYAAFTSAASGTNSPPTVSAKKPNGHIPTCALTHVPACRSRLRWGAEGWLRPSLLQQHYSLGASL